MEKNKLILSIDLDEWFHCRWATGSENARWPSVKECLSEYYGSNKPAGEIIPPTKKILAELKKRKIKATFFILGETAKWYPNLVKSIARDGHEIACHGMHHQDMTTTTRWRFAKELQESRRILERLYGKKIARVSGSQFSYYFLFGRGTFKTGLLLRQFGLCVV